MQDMTTEVLLLDDEEASLALSRQAISRYVPEESIHLAATAEEAMDILKKERIALAFLDVELKGSDGFTLCQYIHQKYPGLKVVILTGHVDLGAKSYDYEPFDFLVKPIDVVRLERTFSRFAQRQKKSDSSRLVIEASTGFALLSTEEIVYIVKSGNICQVHCADGEVHRVAYPLDKLENMLESRGFFRTYQSYLVPVARIRQVTTARFGTSYEAHLDDGSVVPVSRNRYAKLKEFILRRSIHL